MVMSTTTLCVFVGIAVEAKAQDKITTNTVMIEATGQSCAMKPDSVHQFGVKVANQPGLWTIYSPIANSPSIRIKGDKKYGIALVISKVNLESDLCQLIPLADPANKSSFDKLFPVDQGIELASTGALPDQLWYIALSGRKEALLPVGTVPSKTHRSLSTVPKEGEGLEMTILPSYLNGARITDFFIIHDGGDAKEVKRRLVGGPVWGEEWKKDGVLGVVGGVLPTEEPDTYLAWIIRSADLQDRMRFQAHSVIKSSVREELKSIACGAKAPGVEAEAAPVVEPEKVSYDPITVQVPLHDRMVTMLGRWREFRESPRSQADAERLCGSGSLDASASFDFTVKEQAEGKELVGYGALSAMMRCILEEYCRKKGETPNRDLPRFRDEVVDFNSRIDDLSPVEMTALAEAGVSRLQVVAFAQELFVLSHYDDMLTRAKADTAANVRTLCKLRMLLLDLKDWKEISARVPEYPSAWKDQVDELEYKVRRLNRVMVDSLEADLIRRPLDFEGIADLIERNECLSSEEAGLLLSRIMKAKQPKPEAMRRPTNISHAEAMKSDWSSRVRSIAALERLPKWDFTYVSYADSVVMTLRFSGGKAIEEVKQQGISKRGAPPAARACSYGFPLGSCIYPECIPAVELFATFVEENYYKQDNGYSAIGLRIIGSADNTPIRAKLNYPPEILEDILTVPETANANQELAYARAFYARYILNDQSYEWPSVLGEYTTVKGVEVPYEGEEHRNIQLVLVVAPKP